ncbi:MAG: ABC transporter permease [Halobacteria archaeon]
MTEPNLASLTDPVLVKGVKQVAVAVVLAALVLSAAYLRNIQLVQELGYAFTRGFLQVIAMGLLIGVLFSLRLEWSFVVILGMVVFATQISESRGEGLPNSFRISFAGILSGSGVVIASMLYMGAIEPTVRNLVPVAGMIVSSSMKTNSLALERFTNDLSENRDEIEVLLSLGASGETSLSKYSSGSVKASLIPMVESLRSLGLVYIPGMMSGMILAGANPVYAALYQFVIMAMLFSASAITSLVSVQLAGNEVVNEAEQLGYGSVRD